MNHNRQFRLSLAVIAALWGWVALGVAPLIAQAQTHAAPYKAARTAAGQPDLSGIWQSVNTANWDIEELVTAPAPYANLVGAYLAQPAGLSIVEGGTIPYTAEALGRRDRYRAGRLHPDP